MKRLMKRFGIAAILFISIAIWEPRMWGQGATEACELNLTGQNRNREITGSVNVECGFDIHTAPWGNWGVSSPFSRLTDTDQFRGWNHQDGPPTKQQWNSCTTAVREYRAPSHRYYRLSRDGTSYSGNYSDDVVSHGNIRYRYRANRCRWRKPANRGCAGITGYSVTLTSSNYMSLYELDWDGNDFVTTLYFPVPIVYLSGCSESSCNTQTTNWEDPTSSTRPVTGVTAQFSMKLRARRSGYCSNWQ